MSLQSTVNVNQAFGISGALYDNSPRRITSYEVAGGTPVVAVKATEDITLTDVPATTGTVTVGTTVYKFMTTPAAAYDVQIGSGEEACGDNLAAAINADGTAGTEYFAGTLAHPLVTAVSDGAGVVTVTAIYAGVLGNAIALAKTATNTTVGAAALSGGVDADAVNATVGYAFTIDATDKTMAVAGGSGFLAGILVAPKSYSHSGLDATLVVESGREGQLCSMGHVVIAPGNTVTVGMSAYYDTSSGQIFGFSGTGAHAGYTLITSSQFILVDYASAGVAVLSLTNA